MKLSAEIDVARRAVATGAITEDLLRACLAERRRLLGEGAEVSLRSLLLERGLDAARWDALEGAPAQVSAAAVGDYVLEDLLGRGAMGEVWRARHRELDQRYALKLLRGDSPAQRQRFLREGAALAKVGGHPNIVRVHACGVDRVAGAFLVMDLVDGRDLRELLAIEGTLEPARALRLAGGIARAIEHMHRERLVHRDLKPANVLVRREDDVPVVADFGLAFDEAATRLTATGAVLGTPIYMAPEQAFGAACAPSDVYALGAIFYEMLTSVIPRRRATSRRRAPSATACPRRSTTSRCARSRSTRARARAPPTSPSGSRPSPPAAHRPGAPPRAAGVEPAAGSRAPRWASSSPSAGASPGAGTRSPSTCAGRPPPSRRSRSASPATSRASTSASCAPAATGSRARATSPAGATSRP